jgi:hypothetical protein
MSKFNPGANRALWQKFKQKYPSAGAAHTHLGPQLDAVEKLVPATRATLVKLVAEMKKDYEALRACNAAFEALAKELKDELPKNPFLRAAYEKDIMPTAHDVYEEYRNMKVELDYFRVQVDD